MIDRQTHQAGFSLIELMIAMLLGLILVAGVLTLFSSTLNSSRDLTQTQQLETQLQATLGLMARDVRRAGADGATNAKPTFSNPFTLGQAAAYTGEPADSCLLFSYDINGNGILDTSTPDERLGYRLKQGTLQMRKGGENCTGDDWEDVTTPALVTITQLKFAVSTTTVGTIQMRQVTITLAGKLKHDPSVHRTLNRTVNVRNDARAP